MSEEPQEPAEESIWSREDLGSYTEKFQINDIFTKIAMSVTLQRKAHINAQKRLREDLQELWAAFLPEQRSAIKQ